MANAELVYKHTSPTKYDIDKPFDERSSELMVEYFLEDEEYKDLLDDIRKLSPASLDLITYFLVIRDYH